MRNGVLGSLAVLLTCAPCALAQEPDPQTTAAPPQAPMTADAAAPPAPETRLNPHPWNPPLLDANKSPYGDSHCGLCDEFCAFLADWGLGEFWMTGEYLLWGIKDSRTPPLLTVGPPASGAILGQPGTQVLSGGSSLDHGPLSGGRFTAGVWLDDCRTFGFEGSYFFLGERERTFEAASSGETGPLVLGRPYVNALTDTETADPVVVPGLSVGSVIVSAPASFQGAEATGLCRLVQTPAYQVDLLAGFRYLALEEGVGIQEDVALLPSAGALAASRMIVFDDFNTRNRFYGGQVGVRTAYQWNRLIFHFMTKLALGGNAEVIAISGARQITPPGGMTFTRSGGLLAQPTNSGRLERGQLAVVPELALNVTYLFTHHFRAFAGYTFLYWSDVVRAGDQIDRTLNPTQVLTGTSPPVGPARPALAVQGADFWAQGLNFGLEFRY